jgi:hypothetical protein
MTRNVFNRAELERKLRDIGFSLKREVKAYLLGGCAMVFRGQKSATKDVDVVLSSPQSLKHLVASLKSLEFRTVVRLPEDYQLLGASAVLRDDEGFQLDLFYKRVCRGLEITRRMEERAEFFGTFGKLYVYLMAPEDIFLFKGVTDREADLDDMRVLAEAGIDWDTVKEECMLQERRRIWEDFLANKLLELRERYGIESPIIKGLVKAADFQLVKIVFEGIIRDGNHTFAEIVRAVKEKYGYSRSWTWRELMELVEKGVIKRKRVGRVYIYSVAD